MSNKYENFTLSLALFDAIPVIFFSISMLMIAIHFNSILFIIGAILCVLAGLLKVLWKIILAGKQKNIAILNKQMRFTMPVGFLFLIIGIIVSKNDEWFSSFCSSIISLPSLIFLIIALAGFLLMGVFAVKLDGTKAKSNWIEQITNAVLQFFLLVAVCMAI